MKKSILFLFLAVVGIAVGWGCSAVSAGGTRTTTASATPSPVVATGWRHALVARPVASSSMPEQGPARAVDGTLTTAWISTFEERGPQTSLTLPLAESLPARRVRLLVSAGCQASPRAFLSHALPEFITVEVLDDHKAIRSTFLARLKPETGVQLVDVDVAEAVNVAAVNIHIDSVRPGSEWGYPDPGTEDDGNWRSLPRVKVSDVCLSEVDVFTALDPASAAALPEGVALPAATAFPFASLTFAPVGDGAPGPEEATSLSTWLTPQQLQREEELKALDRNGGRAVSEAFFRVAQRQTHVLPFGVSAEGEAWTAFLWPQNLVLDVAEGPIAAETGTSVGTITTMNARIRFQQNGKTLKQVYLAQKIEISEAEQEDNGITTTSHLLDFDETGRLVAVWFHDVGPWNTRHAGRVTIERDAAGRVNRIRQHFFHKNDSGYRRMSIDQQAAPSTNLKQRLEESDRAQAQAARELAKLSAEFPFSSTKFVSRLRVQDLKNSDVPVAQQVSSGTASGDVAKLFTAAEWASLIEARRLAAEFSVNKNNDTFTFDARSAWDEIYFQASHLDRGGFFRARALERFVRSSNLSPRPAEREPSPPTTPEDDDDCGRGWSPGPGRIHKGADGKATARIEMPWSEVVETTDGCKRKEEFFVFDYDPSGDLQTIRVTDRDSISLTLITFERDAAGRITTAVERTAGDSYTVVARSVGRWQWW